MSAVLRHELVGEPTFRTHLGLGIAYGYPLCCTLRFAFQAVRRPLSGQAIQRGCCHGRYVPCGIFHRAR